MLLLPFQHNDLSDIRLSIPMKEMQKKQIQSRH